MLRSALISALSACLAVCTTLLAQHYWFGPAADTAVHQHVPTSIPVDTDGSSNQQQDRPDVVAPAANAIDLAQALGLGRVLLARGEPEEAALVYRVAAATALSAHAGDAGTNRNGGEAQHGLGLALLAANRPEEALQACLEAERLDRSSAAASLCVGVLLVEAGDTAGAVEAFRRALEKAAVSREGSETVDAIRGRLGGALLDAGEVDEAISVLADGNNCNNGNVAYHLGVAWQIKVCLDPVYLDYTLRREQQDLTAVLLSQSTCGRCMLRQIQEYLTCPSNVSIGVCICCICPAYHTPPPFDGLVHHGWGTFCTEHHGAGRLR